MRKGELRYGRLATLHTASLLLLLCFGLALTRSERRMECLVIEA